MAGGGGGGGGKRSANAELNLVPYIDLLSTLICFLLITAVWQNVTVISTNSNITPPSDPDTFNPNPPPTPDKEKIEISLKIKQSHLEFTANKNVTNIIYTNTGLDRMAFKNVLQKAKLDYPDIKEIIINSETGVAYKYLVQTMDILSEEKYNDVAINTN